MSPAFSTRGSRLGEPGGGPVRHRHPARDQGGPPIVLAGSTWKNPAPRDVDCLQRPGERTSRVDHAPANPRRRRFDSGTVHERQHATTCTLAFGRWGAVACSPTWRESQVGLLLAWAHRLSVVVQWPTTSVFRGVRDPSTSVRQGGSAQTWRGANPRGSGPGSGDLGSNPGDGHPDLTPTTVVGTLNTSEQPEREGPRS